MEKRKSKTRWQSFLVNAEFCESLQDFLFELCALCGEALRIGADWKRPMARARLNVVRS
jgi:hypothetical protein